MFTRIDEDLQHYCLAIQGKDQIREKDIRDLLEAYRIKYDVDIVYIGETLPDHRGILFTHMSFSKPQYNFLGKTHFFPAGKDLSAGLYDKNGLCMESLESLGPKTDASVIHYGILHGSECDGNIGMIDFQKRRVWTKEECAAVQKLGRLLRSVFYMERVDKVHAEEQKRSKQQQRLLENSYEVIASLSSDYNFIGLINAKDRQMSVFKANRDSEEVATLASKSDYYEAVSAYLEYVYEEDKETWTVSTSLEHVLEQLLTEKIYYINIRTGTREKTEYVQFCFSKIERKGRDVQVVLAKRVITGMIEAELKQRMLVENALAQAERANAAKSSFLSNMSHDIRTPMNAIIGFTSLAMKRIDEKERVREYLEKIMSSGNHLLQLINDILDMSRIESGKVHMEEQPCSLPEILEELKSMIQMNAAAKKLEFTVEMADVLHEDIFCDRLRLNQIFLNLLSNAVKFTPEGGKIHMRMREKPCGKEGCAQYEFLVRDTGIGMSKTFVEHIFEPFERERTSTISGIQGTGLGMAITKNIVDLMNGAIEVHSRQNEGTEFIVSLTLRLQPSEDQEAIVSAEEANDAAGKQPAPEYVGVRILLAEDNELNREIATEILGEAGFVIETAENGQIAVDMVKRSAPGYYRLILMDVQMPVLNGYDATKAIRDLDDIQLAAIPILAMTANAFEEDKRNALECGMNGHIAKPIDVEILFETLNDILLKWR